MRTLRCILESKNLKKIKNHPQATVIAVYWDSVLYVGYISIWDSTDTGEKFIILDQGMTSEHEQTRFIYPFKNDIIKKG